MDTRSEREKYSMHAEFYKNFEERNPVNVLFLICISAGLYILNWIYKVNKQLEKIDPNAPNPNRGALLIMIFPMGWYAISMVLTTLYTKNILPFWITIVIPLVWIGLFLLLLKYLYDFCHSFSNITRTPGIVWFIVLMIGFLGLYGIAAGVIQLLPFVFFLVITVPAMQAEMNNFCRNFALKRRKNTYFGVN